MKKAVGILICLLIVAMSAFAIADVKINKTSFPDKNFRKYVQRFDKNKNGTLSNSELKAVKTINVSGKSIKDMTGLQYFTSITKLDCSSNPITKLDVSKNNALKTLICEYTDKLKSVKIGKKKNLTTINLSENALTSLDVSGCPALKYLLIDGNKITKLNLKNNPALVTLCVGIYASSHSGNRLKSLDISKNTKLKHLECAHNPLKKIDVSKSPALVKLVKETKRTHWGELCDYWESSQADLYVEPDTVVIAGSKKSKPFPYWTAWTEWTTERKTDIEDNNSVEEDIRYHWWTAKCKNCGTHNPYWGSTTKCVSCKKYLPSTNVQHINTYTTTMQPLQTLSGRKNGTVINGEIYWYAGIEYRYRYSIDQE